MLEAIWVEPITGCSPLFAASSPCQFPVPAFPCAKSEVHNIAGTKAF